MRAARTMRLLPAALLCAALSACAQSPEFEPDVGQDGKDVVWVPTPDALVERMLDMAQVGPRDFVMDLGSGDGRMVIAAAKRGARGLGVEYDPDLVAYARRRAEAAGVADRARFVKADLFQTDLSQATVITLFLLPSINLELRPKLLELPPGTRIVSNTFDMDAWTPDDAAAVHTAGRCEAYCSALMWIVPAKVAGRHALPEGELELKQAFQMLSGTFTSGGVAYAVEGRVRGEDVEIRAGARQFRGRVRGGKLELR